MPDTVTLRGDLPRLRAIELAAGANATFDLSTLWDDLTAGRVRISDNFHTEGHCFLVLQASERPAARLTRRNLDIVERVLLGEAQKVVALDLRLSVSTVAFTVAECLRAMGLDGRTAGAPPVLLMAVQARRRGLTFADARVVDSEHFGLRCQVVTVPRPDLRLGAELTPTECVVARLLLEGNDYEQIASLRRKSLRTVANQLSATFHKLGVSGRSELIHRLIRQRSIQ